MIGADDLIVLDEALRQTGSSVNAEILPDVDLIALIAPDHKIAAHECRRNELVLRHFIHKGDDVPVIDKNFILRPSVESRR